MIFQDKVKSCQRKGCKGGEVPECLGFAARLEQGVVAHAICFPVFRRNQGHSMETVRSSLRGFQDLSEDLLGFPIV